MIKPELTEREAVFLKDLLSNVTGLNSLDPETRASVRELIFTIREKLNSGGINENCIF